MEPEDLFCPWLCLLIDTPSALPKPNNEVTGANTGKTTSSAAKAAMLALDTRQQASMDGEAGPGILLKVMERDQSSLNRRPSPLPEDL